MTLATSTKAGEMMKRRAVPAPAPAPIPFIVPTLQPRNHQQPSNTRPTIKSTPTQHPLTGKPSQIHDFLASDDASDMGNRDPSKKSQKNNSPASVINKLNPVTSLLNGDKSITTTATTLIQLVRTSNAGDHNFVGGSNRALPPPSFRQSGVVVWETIVDSEGLTHILIKTSSRGSGETETESSSGQGSGPVGGGSEVSKTEHNNDSNTIVNASKATVPDRASKHTSSSTKGVVFADDPGDGIAEDKKNMSWGVLELQSRPSPVPQPASLIPTIGATASASSKIDSTDVDVLAVDSHGSKLPSTEMKQQNQQQKFQDQRIDNSIGDQNNQLEDKQILTSPGPAVNENIHITDNLPGQFLPPNVNTGFSNTPLVNSASVDALSTSPYHTAIIAGVIAAVVLVVVGAVGILRTRSRRKLHEIYPSKVYPRPIDTDRDDETYDILFPQQLKSSKLNAGSNFRNSPHDENRAFSDSSSICSIRNYEILSKNSVKLDNDNSMPALLKLCDESMALSNILIPPSPCWPFDAGSRTSVISAQHTVPSLRSAHSVEPASEPIISPLNQLIEQAYRAQFGVDVSSLSLPTSMSPSTLATGDSDATSIQENIIFGDKKCTGLDPSDLDTDLQTSCSFDDDDDDIIDELDDIQRVFNNDGELNRFTPSPSPSSNASTVLRPLSDGANGLKIVMGTLLYEVEKKDNEIK